MIRRSCISTLAAIVLAVALSAANVRAETHEIHGKAQVLSGDTLVVHGQRIRLFGIDAPELGQTCRWPNKTIDCGRISTTGLLDLIAPVAVTCGWKSMRPDGTWITEIILNKQGAGPGWRNLPGIAEIDNPQRILRKKSTVCRSRLRHDHAFPERISGVDYRLDV